MGGGLRGLLQKSSIAVDAGQKYSAAFLQEPLRLAALASGTVSSDGCPGLLGTGYSLKQQHGQGAGSWVGDCAAVPKSAGGSALVVRCGAVQFCAVLYLTGLGVGILLVVSLSAEKSRGLFLVRVFTIIRCDGEGEVVRLDPAQHPCLITLLSAA